MKSTIWVLAIVMALGMGPTVVLLDLRPSNRGERRAEISGRAKSDSLLTDQEAVCLQVVAGARNHLQANGSLCFRFEIVV